MPPAMKRRGRGALGGRTDCDGIGCGPDAHIRDVDVVARWVRLTPGVEA